MLRLFAILVLVFGFLIALRSVYTHPVTTNVVLAAPVEAEATSPPAQNFNETGVLFYYPNNVGPVPYLFYHNEHGSTVSKALIFRDAPLSRYQSWDGARVSVKGELEQSTVLVDSIVYISPP